MHRCRTLPEDLGLSDFLHRKKTSIHLLEVDRPLLAQSGHKPRVVLTVFNVRFTPDSGHSSWIVSDTACQAEYRRVQGNLSNRLGHGSKLGVLLQFVVDMKCE